LHLKPWDKEADTKMQQMLGGISSLGIDTQILTSNGNRKADIKNEEESNTFREHMSHRNKILAMMNDR
jgi:hypothetical protein